MKRRIAIVGSGIGGLTAALLLSHEGYEVTIFEGHDNLGGRLTYLHHEWAGNSERIDRGPTIVLLPEMINELLQLGGMDVNPLHWHRCDPMYSLHYADGSSLVKYANIQAMEAEIERFAPGEGAAFRKYIADMQHRFDVGKPAFLEKSFIRSKDFWTYRNVRTLLQLGAHRSVRKDVKRYFHDPRLIDAFSLQSLYIGGNPYSTPSIYSLVGYSEHQHGVWYLQGGYGGLVQHIERELRNRSNVTLHLNSKVDQIETTHRNVRGLRVEGEVLAFDAVIYNGDFPALNALLNDRMSVQRQRFIASSGCFLLYLGIQGKYEQRMMHEFWMGRNFSQHMKDVFTRPSLPQDPSIYTFYPSIHDTTLTHDPNDSILYVLVPVPSGDLMDWESSADRYANHIISQLELRGFPELRSRLRWLQTRTPTEAKRDGLYAGGSFGIAPALTQSGVFRPQVKPFPQIKGLFAVGASVHPGGGIPIVMQGAKLVQEALRAELS